MTNYSFTAHFQVDGCDADQLEAQCDRVMEELVRLEVIDPAIGAVSGHFDQNDVEVSLVVAEDSYPAAVKEALTLVRTAIHAAEGATPGWPHFGEGTLQRIEASVEAFAEEDAPLAV